MVTENINIDVRPGGIPIVIHVTQYEVGLRKFVFTPYTSAGELTVVAGSATLEGTKPDGNAFQQACTYVDGIVTYVLQEQLCAVSGRVWSRLVIRNIDGDMIGMTAIVWDVGEAGVKDDAVMSDSDISALRQFLDEFGDIDAYRGALNGALAAVGGPLVAATASAMTDTTKVYVYTGSESGYTEGHWYYWNGSAWTDGGVYQSTGINTDKTLTVEDMAADAKATGDAVTGLKNKLIGENVAATGGLLATGYYVKNNRQVTASSNFNTYKYSLSGVKYVEITTYGYNSTAAVASDSDYDASTLPGKTFSTADVMIYPSTTISTISPWTENAIVDGYDYLYVSCYKNNTPEVKFYGGDGAYPASVKNSAEINTLKANDLSAVHSYTTLINTADKWAVFGNDTNNLTPNGIYGISYASGISNLPYEGFNGFVISYMTYYGGSNGWMQTATNGAGKRTFVRMLWSGSWTSWEELALGSVVNGHGADIDNLYYTNDLWKVFHRVGVIGDSLASGESASNEGGTTTYHDLYPFSWGQCMARDSGNTYYNFSKGGLTTKTWMTDTDYGYALASQPDKLCDMYIIGLGQNDAGQSMTVGSASDINFNDPDQNADTFYGNYAKIIQKMQALAPKAPIFVCSRPTVPASNAYESAIRAMPTLFDNVYLLDMYKHVTAYYAPDSIIRRCLRSGHYNAVGYQVMSKHIEQEISNVVKDNLDDFLQVEFINTDWSWNS